MKWSLWLILIWLPDIESLIENGGFPCKIRDSMRLDRRIHGQPQKTLPPFEISVLDEKGQRISEYSPRQTYKVRLLGYVHFRGVIIQPRLCTPDGHLIGSLRGGHFIEEETWQEYGITFQECNHFVGNDSITHANEDKKFIAEMNWSTEKDIGAVQFMSTIASDDGLFWERWRPRSAFIRPVDQRRIVVNESLFSQDSVMERKVTATEEKEALENLGGLPFDPTLFATMEAKSENQEHLETLSSEPVIPLRKEAPRKQPQGLAEETSNTLARNRVFKKFGAEPGLSSTDLRFLNSHTLIQKDFVTELDPEEICRLENPCENDGVCVPVNERVKCECKTGWTGTNCTERDYCLGNACASNSRCENNARGDGYNCICMEGFVGTYCQFECLTNQCMNGGKCVIKPNGQLGCECAPGWSGAKCSREIDECNLRKCKNGAQCSDLFNDYRCNCTSGWMGKDCDRPCQDVYKSCRVWKREGQCELMRPTSNFFDLNCAASCGKCEYLNTTIITDMPLAPILLPFHWLLGEWQTYVKGYRNKSIDYPFDMLETAGYNETLTFSAGEVLVFGTPSVNFSSYAVSESDPSHIHESHGFLTIRQYPPAGDTRIKASLSTVDNNGVILIEEGELRMTKTTAGNHLNLEPTYLKVFQEDLTPTELHRSFVRKGDRLMQLFSKVVNGRSLKYTKTYTRTRHFDYL